MLRRGWIILLAVVMTTGSGFVLSKLKTHVYRATQKVLIKPARADFGLTQTLKQLISSWQSRLDTELRAQDAIDALHLDMTAAQLHSMVTITADLNNLLLTVDVDMKDGSEAEKVATVYGTQFIDLRNQENQPRQLANRINAELRDSPHYR